MESRIDPSGSGTYWYVVLIETSSIIVGLVWFGLMWLSCDIMSVSLHITRAMCSHQYIAFDLDLDKITKANIVLWRFSIPDDDLCCIHNTRRRFFLSTFLLFNYIRVGSILIAYLSTRKNETISCYHQKRNKKSI